MVVEDSEMVQKMAGHSQAWSSSQSDNLQKILSLDCLSHLRMLERTAQKIASAQRMLKQSVLLPLQQLQTCVDLPQCVQIFEKMTLVVCTLMEPIAPFH